MTGSGTDLGKSYILFIRSNLDTLSKRITDDCWILIVTERYYQDKKAKAKRQKQSTRWYHGQMGMLATWLTNRMDKALHPYQCTCLSHIVKVSDISSSSFFSLCPSSTPISLFSPACKRANIFIFSSFLISYIIR